MSIVQEGGPAPDPLLLQRGGYAVVVVAIIIGIVVLFVPDPLFTALDLVSALASAAVTMPAPELFEISSRRGRSRGFNPLFLAPAALVFFAGVEADFIDVTPLLIAPALGAAALAGIGLTRWRRPGVAGPRQFVIGLALIGAAVGYGGAALIDVRFDSSPPQPYRATVASMYVSHGKSTTYQLRLAPWGPRTQPGTVSVSSMLYNQLNPGDTVCIALRRGALSVPWFEVDACPDAG